MKVLLDTCVSGGAGDELANAGHDVVWCGDWDSDPGDEDILRFACADGRVLVTIDKDFGELAVLRGVPHCGILRIVNFRAREQGTVCIEVVRIYGAQLRSGAIVTAEPGRVRVRDPG